jgi:hypothetical protein
MSVHHPEFHWTQIPSQNRPAEGVWSSLRSQYIQRPSSDEGEIWKGGWRSNSVVKYDVKRSVSRRNRNKGLSSNEKSVGCEWSPWLVWGVCMMEWLWVFVTAWWWFGCVAVFPP